MRQGRVTYLQGELLEGKAGQGIECGEVPQRSHQKGLICPPSCMVFLWVMGTSRGFKLGRDRFKLYCSRMLTQATTGKMK